MSFVHDHQFGACANEVVSSPVGLDEIQRDDHEGEVIEEGFSPPKIALQSSSGAREYKFGFDVKLLVQLSLPLLSQVRRAEHGQSLDLTSVNEFAGHQPSLNRLTNAHVVSNEQSNRIQFQGHQERHKLVGPWLYIQPSKRAERASA